MIRPMRVCQRRAPQRQQSNPLRISPGLPRRRSSRLQSKQLGICHEPQGLFEQRSTDSKSLEPVGATLYTSLPTSDPVEATVPKPLREQSEEQLYLSKKQGCSAQILPPANSRKRRVDSTTEIIPPPLKRLHLTQTNSQRPRIEEKEAEQVAKSVQQPKPLPLKRLYATFLGESVNRSPSSPASKKYRPDAVDTFVTLWVESNSGSESYRKRHCRSDSLLTRSGGEPISRRLTRSTPNMAYRHDGDGYAVPLTPAHSVGSFDAASSARGSGRSSGKSLVESPYYRDMNLAANNIYLRHPCEQFPEHVTSLVDCMGKNRDSPGPSLDQVKQDRDLYDLGMGSAEPMVEKYFHTNVFPDPKSRDSLKRTDRNPMTKRAVPETSLDLKVSGPVPDMLYGYNRQGAFPQQQAHLISMGTEMVANTQGLMYPFFIIEFKGDSPGASGSLWVATNQCLGGSASCVNIAERLNRQLRECRNKEVKPIDSAAFSIAMNGTEARLYISWKHDELKYYMQNVESFLLQRPDHYLEFRKYVRNIIDWGKHKRLREIRDSLDILLEKNRKTASQQAKSRPPPSDESSSCRVHKRKDSSTEHTPDHSLDDIQDSQSWHYQSYEEDDPNSQLVEETVYYTSFSDQDGYNVPTAQPLSSDYGYIATDTPQPLTSDHPINTAGGYNLTDDPQVLTADSVYNPDTSSAQNYDHIDALTNSTTPYSSENVSPPLESYEGADDSNGDDYRTTRQSRSRSDNHRSRKSHRRH